MREIGKVKGKCNVVKKINGMKSHNDRRTEKEYVSELHIQ